MATTLLKTRPLGSRGPALTVVGLGAWAMGGDGWFGSWGPQDDDDSVRAVHAALDNGVNWIDTAPIYGLGHSEEVVGRAIKGRRDDVFIATKCTNRWRDDRTIYRTGDPASIREECEHSLQRLGIETIDLLQIHSPVDDTPIEETWGELARLVDEGKARFIGLSNASVEQHQACEAIRHVDSSQPPYNLMNRGIEDGLLPWCLENGTGVIPYGTMFEGLLSGTFDVKRLKGDDLRLKPEWQPRIEAAAKVVEKLRPLAEKRDLTVGQLAIAWAVAHPAVTSAIVGIRTPAQAEQNVIPAQLEDDASLRDAVEAALADM